MLVLQELAVGAVLNVRLDDETHRSVSRIAKAQRRSKSEVVREAITEYARRESPKQAAYDAWKDVIGIAKDLPADLSERTGERFTQA